MIKEGKTELLLGQVIYANRGQYIVDYNDNRISAEVSGRFKYTAFEKSDYPVVGDYVYLHLEGNDFGIIETIKSRKGILSRTDVGTIGEEHILATNVDMVFICMSLNKDFNIRKLRNFITLTYGKDIETIILFTKKDVAEDLDIYLNQLDETFDQEIMITSSFDKQDIDKIREKIADKTVVFIGSSGVGKSTIINKLLNEDVIKTSGIRESDAQGHHTTTSRELIKLPEQGKVIDTPGIRVVLSYLVDESSFEDIKMLEQDCKFRNCTHTNEPECNVLYSIETGLLSSDRFEQYLKAKRVSRYNQKRELERQKLRDRKPKKY